MTNEETPEMQANRAAEQEPSRLTEGPNRCRVSRRCPEHTKARSKDEGKT